MAGLNLLVRTLVLTVLSLPVALVYAYEYVYPVAYTNTPYGTRVLLLYQDIDGDPSLYTWDPKTNIVRKAMPSHYTPAYIAVLPDESGFSFIDNGILRIKKFAKRSARTIEMLDPLYDFCGINWIDTDKAYVSAKCRECYEIFELDCEGIVEPIIAFDGVHCVYPQKVNTTLFYVESCTTFPYNSCLVRIEYPGIKRIASNFNDKDHFDYRVQRIIQNDFERDRSCHARLDSRVMLCDLGDMQVIGFTMASEDEGLLVAILQSQDMVAQCGCFAVKRREGNRYGLDVLFTFFLPLPYISSLQSPLLYESYMPLLPVKNDEHACIYFSDMCLDGYLALFSYDLLSSSITRISPQEPRKSHFFKVLSTPEGTWYGGSIESTHHHGSSDASCGMPHLWIDEEQMVCLQLPEISA